MKLLGVCGMIFLLCACVQQRQAQNEQPVYEGARKMNSLALGMTKEDVLRMMGAPVSTAASSPIECLEYRLLGHTENYVRTSPDPYFVALFRGKVVEYGKNGCTPYEMEQITGRISRNALRNIPNGITQEALFNLVPSEPRDKRQNLSLGIECYEYVFYSGDTKNNSYYVLLKNNVVVASGQPTREMGSVPCVVELESRNFKPGGKYHMLNSRK